MNIDWRYALQLAAALSAALSAAQGLAESGEEQTGAEQEYTAPTAAFPWPQQFTQAGQTYTIYPPRLDRWDAGTLQGRAAVGVQPEGSERPVFGVVWLFARTQVDGSAVTVRDVTLERASFPTADDRSNEFLTALRAHLEGFSWTLSVERLRATLAIDQAGREAERQPLRNEPPRILYAKSPTILVPIDGQPVLREMAGFGLMRVINTRALILLDKASSLYFLSVAGRWMEAPSLDGPWAEAQVRPSTLDEAQQQALASGQADLLEGYESESGRAPAVMVTTGPAELVQTDGPPQYSPIDGTQLLYVTNSPNRLFLDLPTQQHYVLLAGRWYRTRSLQRGPWEYVAGTSLPADFAAIPDSHATESVRAAVPGTPQAQEAAIANSVPQMATVKRAAAQLEITYDGVPEFEPIAGTSLHYAVNAPMPVIRVDANSYFALDNGVWFAANSPSGPWTAASSVPAVIYTIPRSSPLHYVTYVRVYDATADEIYEGYTPGYVGSYVAPGGTVVYGTGWYYQPWVGTVWYGPPVTWGFGFSMFYSWWDPWPWRPWGWYSAWRPYPCFRPWWGPWFAPVAVRPAPPFRGPPFPGAHAGVPFGHRFAAPSMRVTNIYHRWGRQTVAPFAPRVHATLGSPGFAPQPSAPRGSTAAPSAEVLNRPHRALTPAFPGSTPGGRGAGVGANAASPIRRPMAAAESGGNPDWQIYRHMDGQWQRFTGNGHWQTLNALPPNAAERLGRSGFVLPAGREQRENPALPPNAAERVARSGSAPPAGRQQGESPALPPNAAERVTRPGFALPAGRQQDGSPALPRTPMHPAVTDAGRLAPRPNLPAGSRMEPRHWGGHSWPSRAESQVAGVTPAAPHVLIAPDSGARAAPAPVQSFPAPSDQPHFRQGWSGAGAGSLGRGGFAPPSAAPGGGGAAGRAWAGGARGRAGGSRR